MIKGFWILIHDGWSHGLNMINPRLLEDEFNNNWWSYNTPDEKHEKIKTLLKNHDDRYYKIVE